MAASAPAAAAMAGRATGGLHPGRLGCIKRAFEPLGTLQQENLCYCMDLRQHLQHFPGQQTIESSTLYVLISVCALRPNVRKAGKDPKYNKPSTCPTGGFAI